MLESLRKIYRRDLAKLSSEIEAYQSDEAMWAIQEGITNSGGNLCLHLVGNLKTFIGHELGGFTYVRDREFEFAGKNVPKADLLKQIAEATEIVDQSLVKLVGTDLSQEYGLKLGPEKNTNEAILLHLSSHLAYHIGQINYHRRMLDVA
ncbi:MAG: DUF1572 family protein [Bacteroidia bacterium]